MVLLATRRFRGDQRLIHDPADRAGAAATLGAATKAMIDLAGGARCLLARRERRAHVLIGENVARADDHRGQARPNWYDLQLSVARAKTACKEKILFIGVLIIRARNSLLIDY